MQIARLLSGFVLLSSLLLQSCQQEPLRITAEEEYIREFYKTFRNVDPDHDWNLAQKSTVTVKTSVPSSIRVLADVKGTRYLFADYKDAQGTTEIPVTLPKGVSDIIVSVNGQNFPSTLGATVDATSAKSRTINEGNKTILKYGRAPQRLFPATYIGKSLEMVPEEQDNLNREGILNDFFFISEANKPVTIYPVYWNTSSSHVLGVYWLNDDGSFPWCANPEEIQDEDVKAIPSYANMQDLYYTRSGELEYTPVMYADLEGTTDIKWYKATDYQSQSSYPGENGETLTAGQRKGSFRTDGIQITFNKSNVNFGFYIKVKSVDKTGDITTIPNPWGGDTELEVTKRPPLTMNEEGFCADYNHIVFSHTRRNKNFGRVIKVEQDGATQYLPSSPENNPDDTEEVASNKSFNEYVWTNPWSSATETLQKYVGASYFHVTNLDGVTRSYFAFEDWRNLPDLNDLIFLVDSEVRVIEEGEDPEPDPEPYKWIIAAEDLGGSYDWDFNDLVAEVQLLPVSDGDKAYTKVTVKPLASGGIRPVYLMYTGKTYDINNGTEADVKNYIVGGEFHSLFGGSSHGTPINVMQSIEKTADEIVFYTPAGHTVATPHDKYDSENPNMGGFWVLSCEENNPLSGISGTTNGLQRLDVIPDGHGINQVGAPDSNKELTSPQIMCLEAGWRWPLEKQNISDAYTGFDKWVEESTQTGWIDNGNEEYLIDKY